MGSYKEYCNFSHIALNTDCVLIPLKSADKNSANIDCTNYHLYTLPIFGEYNGYGGIENIQKDENTKLIEQCLNCTIEEFCNNLIEHNIENIGYCWVDRNVWDIMVKGVKSDYFDVNRIVSGNVRNKLYILGLRRNIIFDMSEEDLKLSFIVEIKEEYESKLSNIQKAYYDNINNNEINKLLIDTLKVRNSAFCFSEYFKPVCCYITPQFGAYREHAYFLNKFSKINKMYI